MSDYRHLIACPYCDAIYQRTPLRGKEKLVCNHCHSTIDDGMSDFRACFHYALTALILLLMANLSPFITLNLKGSLTTISVFSSIKALFEHDLNALGVLMMLTIMVLPAWYLLAVLWSIVSYRFKILPFFTRRFMHWFYHISPWNMLEVYLIGVMVTLVKIVQMADLKLEVGFYAFCGLMLCSIEVNRRFDLHDALFLLYAPSSTNRQP